jgi:hypothetical protein
MAIPEPRAGNALGSGIGVGVTVGVAVDVGVAAPQTEHTLFAQPEHRSSHAMAQQNASNPQTVASQEESSQPVPA